MNSPEVEASEVSRELLREALSLHPDLLPLLDRDCVSSDQWEPMVLGGRQKKGSVVA